MKNEKGYQERQILFTTGTRAALEQNIGMTRQNMKEIGPRAFPNVLIYAGNFSHAEKKRIESALSIGTSTGTKIEIYLANYLENEDQRKALLRILKPLIKERTEHHPDKGGDAEKFKSANEAYQVLSDKDKRAKYDRYGSADTGGFSGGGYEGGQSQGFGGFDFSGFSSGFGGGGFGGGINMDDILRGFAGAGFGQQYAKGRDIESSISISFADSLKGVKKEIIVPVYTNGKKDGEQKVSFEVPAGVHDGQTLRVGGYGESVSGGRSGDLHVNISVSSDKRFSRVNDYDVYTTLSLKLSESILGIKKKIETPLSGEKEIDIPEGVSHGQTLRLKGEGVHGRRKGDLLIEISVIMPKRISKHIKEAAEILAKEGY